MSVQESTSVDDTTSTEATQHDKDKDDVKSKSSQELAKLLISSAPTSEETGAYLRSLNNRVVFRRKKGEDDILKLGKTLSENGFVTSFSEALGEIGPSYFDEPLYSNIKRYFVLVGNITEVSPDMCKKVAESDLFEKLLKILSEYPELSVSNFKNEEKKQNTQVVSAVGSFFEIFNNTLRIHQKSKYNFRELKGIDACLEYMKTPILSVKIKALLTLAFSADLEASAEVLSATESNIEYILDRVLEASLQSPTRRSDKYGYSVAELLEGLTLLAKNETNAKGIFTCNGLKKAESILDENVSAKEVLSCLSFIECICFLPEAKKSVTESAELLEKMRKLGSRTESGIADTVKGILWEVEGKDAKEEKESEGMHVMISYNWTHQDIALQMRDELRKRGIKVWMDVEKMEGDMLARMAEAVEDACVVIACLSEHYRDSVNCRREAHYALQLKKPVVPVMMVGGFQPRGWLGLLVGMNLYYNLYGENFAQEFPKMFDALQQYVKVSEEVLTASKQSELGSGSAEPEIKSYAGWDISEVCAWYEGLALSQPKSPIVENLDGTLLKELKEWQNKHPEFFCKIVRNDFALSSTVDMLKFCSELRKLK